MNKKGFTLIEILAVIVILGVIMVIAIPYVSHLITKSKINSLKVSADGIMRAAQLYQTDSSTSDEVIKFTIVNGEEIGENKLNYKGKIDSGTIMVYGENEVALCVTNDRFTAIKNINDKEITVSEGTCLFNEETQAFESKEYCGDYVDELNELKSLGTATSSNILTGESALINGNLVTGTMPNNGNLTSTINAGQSYTIPAGYTSGGTITAASMTTTDVTIIDNTSSVTSSAAAPPELTKFLEKGMYILTIYVRCDGFNGVGAAHTLSGYDEAITIKSYDASSDDWTGISEILIKLNTAKTIRLGFTNAYGYERQLRWSITKIG